MHAGNILKRLSALSCVLFLTPCALTAQTFKTKDLAPAQPPNSLEGHTQTLNDILHDYWQDKLKHAPEFASAVGDKRFDDRLSDDSPAAYNAAVAQGAQFIEQLGSIDTTGMNEEEKSKKDQLVQRLIDQQESSACKPWQTPITESYGIQVELPLLAQTLRFTSPEDYDRYIARLNEVPAAFLQIATNLSLGQQAGRSESPATMQKVIAQLTAIVQSKPEDTPFAHPLHQFPAGISPSQQAEIRKQILTAIHTRVQPAYARLAKYLSAEYIPQARKQPRHTEDAACSVSTNARSFDAGRTQILELRASAEKSLGENFNLDAFRDAVKNSISLPPEAFQQQIEAWITQQQK